MIERVFTGEDRFEHYGPKGMRERMGSWCYANDPVCSMPKKAATFSGGIVNYATKNKLCSKSDAACDWVKQARACIAGKDSCDHFKYPGDVTKSAGTFLAKHMLAPGMGDPNANVAAARTQPRLSAAQRRGGKAVTRVVIATLQ